MNRPLTAAEVAEMTAATEAQVDRLQDALVLAARRLTNEDNAGRMIDGPVAILVSIAAQLDAARDDLAAWRSYTPGTPEPALFDL